MASLPILLTHTSTRITLTRVTAHSTVNSRCRLSRLVLRTRCHRALVNNHTVLRTVHPSHLQCHAHLQPSLAQIDLTPAWASQRPQARRRPLPAMLPLLIVPQLAQLPSLPITSRSLRRRALALLSATPTAETLSTSRNHLHPQHRLRSRRRLHLPQHQLLHPAPLVMSLHTRGPRARVSRQTKRSGLR